MKKSGFTALSIALCFACAITGCSENSESNDVKVSEMTLLTELDITYESVKDGIERIPNINAAEDMEIIVPENAESVYSYTSKPDISVDMKSYYNDFMELYNYIYPDHPMDKDYLIYCGGSSVIEYDDNGNTVRNYNKVSDYYDKIIDGSEGRVHFIYDETWYRNLDEWNTPVCLEIGNPMGYGYGIINKGGLVGASGIKVMNYFSGEAEYPCLESFDPADHIQKNASFAPNSTESYRLADKEMSINEAVLFFEDYVNNLPFPKEKNCRTVVRNVDVYKVTDDTYGYYFNTNKEYLGVQFDYMKNGTSHSGYDNYSPSIGSGFMTESTDVDIVNGIYLRETAENSTPYTEILSFEKAAEIIGSHLTQEVTFELKMTELIYTSEPAKDSNGYIDIENSSSKIKPAWKLTLYNPNDRLVYVCYVDAADGGNFRYYKIYNSN